jgi:two-component system CheB/CheR fusion protein
MATQNKPAGGIAQILRSREDLSTEHLSTSQLKSLLDSLPSNIALIDSEGEILLVNEAWRKFAEENGMNRVESEHGNYLQVCESAARSGDEVARKTLQGLKKVLAGDSPTFEMEYPCHSPQTERWFRVNVARVELWGDRCAVVTHFDLTRAA